MGYCPWQRAVAVAQTSWCSLFRLFQSLWRSKSLSFLEKAVQLWDYWIIITMVWKLFNQSSTESCVGWYILFLVWCLIWSPSGLFIRAFIFCHILLVTSLKLFFMAVLLPFMRITANVPGSLTRLAILNYFNKTWIICINGMLGISRTLMLRNAKSRKFLGRFNHLLLVSSWKILDWKRLQSLKT